jgi:catechol 2,3-dioxygenase-like lactoylglutathione lyase family enzyme
METPNARGMTSSPPHATTGGAVPILRVANVESSIAYYLAQLGFEPEWRSDPVASVRRDETSIMLCEDDQGHPGTWLWISASDVDVLYAELHARGARLRHPPANYPWGSRECQVTDPDGHVLRFGADLREGEPMGEWLDGSGKRWLPLPDGGWRAVD